MEWLRSVGQVTHDLKDLEERQHSFIAGGSENLYTEINITVLGKLGIDLL